MGVRVLCHSVLSALLLLLPAGCGRQPDPPVYSVMSYNLHRYGLEDRDDDGAADDPKPQAQRDVITGLIARSRPDVLALQEMGDSIVFAGFRRALEAQGAVYPFAELLQRGGSAGPNLAVLSRFPIAATHHHTNEWYSIGPAKVPVSRGFLDVEIQVTPAYRLRLINAHLKSKVYHPLGQTEMRRNEARLLNKLVRSVFKSDPDVNLLVAGDMNDSYASAPLREVQGRRGGALTDLRPADATGDVWTCFVESTDSYVRFDYLFASPGLMQELVREQTRAVRSPQMLQGSDHRPLIGVFRCADR